MILSEVKRHLSKKRENLTMEKKATNNLKMKELLQELKMEGRTLEDFILELQEDNMTLEEFLNPDNEIREWVTAADGTSVILPRSLVSGFLEEHGGSQK